MNGIPLKKTEDNGGPVETVSVDAMLDVAEHMAMTCTGCGLCAKDCEFLKQYGNPGEIAQGLYGGAIGPNLAYACSMCGLCGAMCPVGLEPRLLFRAMRRQAVRDGSADLKPYRRLLAYEAKGASPRYSFHHLPADCKSVFFPGCTLPGARPLATRWLIGTLRELDPGIGVVLDCCHKPSEDLGRENHFRAMFEPLKNTLLSHGAERVLVACPNCYAIFSEYAPELKTVTVYEELAAIGKAREADDGDLRVAVHDPCAVRTNTEAHAAVRNLLGVLGVEVSEPKHSGKKTICCGEGGAVGFVARDLARNWTDMRQAEAGDLPVVTYCAGCAARLSRSMQTMHVLDLLADPAPASGVRSKASGWPWTYLNRLLLKRELSSQAVSGFVSQRKK